MAGIASKAGDSGGLARLRLAGRGLAWLRQANKLALVSVVLSVAWLEGFGSALGIMAAAVALRQIRASGHEQRGYWVAVAGLAGGAAGLLAVIVMGTVSLLGWVTGLGHR